MKISGTFGSYSRFAFLVFATMVVILNMTVTTTVVVSQWNDLMRFLLGS